MPAPVPYGHIGFVSFASRAAIALLLVGGCSRLSLPQPGPAGRGENQMSKEELAAALDDFQDYYATSIRQAAGDLDAATTDPAIRKNTLLWQVRMIAACQTILKQEDALKAFLDVWTLCIRMRQYFEDGDGRGLFGPHQDIAVRAARQIEADIERIGRMLLPEDRLAKAREDVRSFARANPIRGTFASTVAHTPPAGEDAPNTFQAILGLPLAPFRVFEGVDRGAEAIRDFTRVADRFTDQFEALPETTRWQLLLLLLDLQNDPTVSTSVASFERLSHSSERLSRSAETLPGQLRQEAEALLEQVDARQANIQTTLQQADRTATTVHQALEQVDRAAATLEETARSVAEAGRAWDETARTIGRTVREISNRPPNEATPAGERAFPPSPEPRRPAEAPPAPLGFDGGEARDVGSTRRSEPPPLLESVAGDKPDFEQTVRTLGDTAVELRRLAEQIRLLIESPQLSAHIREVDARLLGAVGATAEQARGVTDHAVGRLAWLIVLAFVLAAAYRAATQKWLVRSG